MDTFFSWLYGSLYSIYGSDSYWIFRGIDPNTGSQIDGASNLFIPIGVATVVLALVGIVLYYFIINSSALAKWWKWLIYALALSVVAYTIGFFGVKNTGDQNIHLFAFANVIVFIEVFLLLTVVFKRFSTNCKHTPWKSILPK